MACTSGSEVLDPRASSGPQLGGKMHESVEDAGQPPAARHNPGSSSSSSRAVWGLRARSLSLTGEGLKAIRWLGRRLSFGKNASSLSNGDEVSGKSTAHQQQSASPPAAGGAVEQTKLISPMPLAAMGSVRSNPLIVSTVRRSSIPIRFHSAQNMVMPTLEEVENPLEKSADGDEMQQDLLRTAAAPRRSFVHKQAVNSTAPMAENKCYVFKSGEVYPVLSTATKRVSWASTSDQPVAKWPDVWMCIENSYAYAKIGREVGPLGIHSVHKFCEELAGLLTVRPTAGRHIVVFTGNTTAKRTNLAFLLGCFLVAREGYSAERAWAVFDNVKPSPFCTFTDLSGGAGSALQLSLYECIQGFSQAFTQGMYDATIFSAREHSFDQALVGGMLQKVVALPNVMDQQQMASSCSPQLIPQIALLSHSLMCIAIPFDFFPPALPSEMATCPSSNICARANARTHTKSNTPARLQAGSHMDCPNQFGSPANRSCRASLSSFSPTRPTRSPPMHL